VIGRIVWFVRRRVALRALQRRGEELSCVVRRQALGRWLLAVTGAPLDRATRGSPTGVLDVRAPRSATMPSAPLCAMQAPPATCSREGALLVRNAGSRPGPRSASLCFLDGATWERQRNRPAGTIASVREHHENAAMQATAKPTVTARALALPVRTDVAGLGLDRQLGRLSPLDPRAVVDTSVGIFEQVLQREPCLARSVADRAVRDHLRVPSDARIREHTP